MSTCHAQELDGLQLPAVLRAKLRARLAELKKRFDDVRPARTGRVVLPRK